MDALLSPLKQAVHISEVVLPGNKGPESPFYLTSVGNWIFILEQI